MKQMLMCAAFAAMTVWAGTLWAVDSSATPLTGRLVLNGNPMSNKFYQAAIRVLWKKGGLIERDDYFTEYFNTDSDGYFSFSLPRSLTADDQVVLESVRENLDAPVSVNVGLDVVTTPYALVAAEAKKLVGDGDLILSDAMLTVTDKLDVKGTAWVTNGLAVSESLTTSEFPTSVVNVANTRDVKLDGSVPDGGRLLWFGAEETVMSGRVGGNLKSFWRGSSNNWLESFFLPFDSAATSQREGVVCFSPVVIDTWDLEKKKESWFKSNDWKATTDGFCTWSAQFALSGGRHDLGTTYAGISVRSDDGHVLTVLPEGVVQGAQILTFPVRKGDVVTVKYSLDMSAAVRQDFFSHMTLEANMSLRFRPIGLGKRGE